MSQTMFEARGDLDCAIPYVVVNDGSIVGKCVNVHLDFIIDNPPDAMSRILDYRVILEEGAETFDTLGCLSSNGSLCVMALILDMCEESFKNQLETYIERTLADCTSREFEDLKAAIEYMENMVAKCIKNEIETFLIAASGSKDSGNLIKGSPLYRKAQEYFDARSGKKGTEVSHTTRFYRVAIYAGGRNTKTGMYVTKDRTEHDMGELVFFVER